MARASRELDNYPEGEIREMIELFKSRGMSHDDATEVIKRMAKYKTFFVNLMMTEELALPVRCARRSKCLPFSGRLAARAHLSSCPAHCCWTLAPARLTSQVPDEDDNNEGLKDALAMFVSFTGFGMLPVMGFVVVPLIIPDLDDHSLFLVACVITAFALFGLGAFKVRTRRAPRQPRLVA